MTSTFIIYNFYIVAVITLNATGKTVSKERVYVPLILEMSSSVKKSGNLLFSMALSQ